MTDAISPHSAPPALSDAALADYRRQLADPAFQRDYPAQFHALKSSVDRAWAETGQSLEVAPVKASPETHRARQFGVNIAPQAGDYAVTVNPEGLAADQVTGIAERTAELGARLQLPAYFKPILEQIANARDVDPAAVRRVVGDGYDAAIAAVEKLFNRGEAIPFKPQQLPAEALVHLAAWGRHLAKFDAKG